MRLTAAAGLIAAFVASALSQFGQQERCYSWPPRQTGKHANRATGLLAGVLARKRLCSIDVFAQDASYRQVAKYQHAKGANAGNDEDIPPFRSLDSKKQKQASLL